MTEPDARAEGPAPTQHDYDQYLPRFAEFAALAPDDPRRGSLRDELVRAHLPVARNIARRFERRGEPLEDLVQVATVGLINAVDRYDPAVGSAFLPFAVPTIVGEVRRYFRDSSWAVRVPRRLKELHLSVAAASNELAQRLGRAPRPSELAEHLNVPQEDVFEALAAGAGHHGSSLDELAAEQNQARLGVEDTDLLGVDDREALRPLLAELPDRERRIIVLRFYREMSQADIARRVGVSQMHVSRLLARTLGQLRDALGEDSA